MDLDEFEWLNDEDSKECIIALQRILPPQVLEHALYLIEAMYEATGANDEPDYCYRRRIVQIMYEYTTTDKPNCRCDSADHYDVFHEFVFYLEGWLWYVDNNDKSGEYGSVKLMPLK